MISPTILPQQDLLSFLSLRSSPQQPPSSSKLVCLISASLGNPAVKLLTLSFLSSCAFTQLENSCSLMTMFDLSQRILQAFPRDLPCMRCGLLINLLSLGAQRSTLQTLCWSAR